MSDGVIAGWVLKYLLATVGDGVCDNERKLDFSGCADCSPMMSKLLEKRVLLPWKEHGHVVYGVVQAKTYPLCYVVFFAPMSIVGSLTNFWYGLASLTHESNPQPSRGHCTCYVAQTAQCSKSAMPQARRHRRLGSSAQSVLCYRGSNMADPRIIDRQGFVGSFRGVEMSPCQSQKRFRNQPYRRRA